MAYPFRCCGGFRYLCKTPLEQIPQKSFLIKLFFKILLTTHLLYVIILCAAKKPQPALLAQLDRVTDYESVGQGFESLAAHQEKSTCPKGWVLFCLCEKGLEPPNGTTALIKRFCESFLAGEICECKRRRRFFVDEPEDSPFAECRANQ